MVDCCIVARTSLLNINSIQDSIIYNCFQSLRFYSSFSDSGYFWNLVAAYLETTYGKDKKNTKMDNDDVFFNDKFVKLSEKWILERPSNNGSHLWQIYVRLDGKQTSDAQCTIISSILSLDYI